MAFIQGKLYCVSKLLWRAVYDPQVGFLSFRNNNTIQYNNLFAFPCEIRLQEIYIHIFFFYDKMLSNFEICI